MLRLGMLALFACGFSLGMAQRFHGLFLQLESSETIARPYEVPIEVVIEQFAGRPVRVNAELRVAAQAGAMFTTPAIDWANVSSVSVRLLPAEGIPTRFVGSKARLIPMANVPGMPDTGFYSIAGSALGRETSFHRVFGYPFFRHTIDDSVEFSTTVPLVFRYSRADRPAAAVITQLRLNARMADGARNDSAFTSFMETYNGQLIPLSLMFRDGQTTSRSLSLRRPMMPSDYKRVHFFMSRFEFDGGALPGAAAFQSGDDMRFSLDLGIPGVRSMPSVDIKDRASLSLAPAATRSQVVEPMLATHLTVWMETGEKALHESLDPELIFDLVGGRVITMSLRQGLNPRQGPGRGPHNVFARVMQIPQSNINGASLGVPLQDGDKFATEPALNGIPIHAIRKMTLRLKLTGTPPEGQQEWDLKSMIIAASRSSRFNLNISNEWVPLYVNAGLNKRFRASVNTGRTNDRIFEMPVNLAFETYDVVRRPGG